MSTTVLVGLLFVLQQYLLYLEHWKVLHTLRDEAAAQMVRIQQSMYSEKQLQQQLAEAEQQHSALRELLPLELHQDEFEQQVSALAERSRIKVLASRTAIHSRPGYQEATVNVTLEAKASLAREFTKALRDTPRLIVITPAAKPGKKSTHLSISFFAVGANKSEIFTPPTCIELTDWLVLPPLSERLARLHADYNTQCRFVANYAEHYHRQLRLHSLNNENTRLQRVAQQIREAE